MLGRKTGDDSDQRMQIQAVQVISKIETKEPHGFLIDRNRGQLKKSPVFLFRLSTGGLNSAILSRFEGYLGRAEPVIRVLAGCDSFNLLFEPAEGSFDDLVLSSPHDKPRQRNSEVDGELVFNGCGRLATILG